MIEEQCVDIIKSTRFASLDADEQERLLTIFIHDLGVGEEAKDSDFVKYMVDPELLSDTGYTLLGRSERSVSFDLAVQYNAMAITASVCEDFVSGTHPGAILFPLLLAQAEQSSLQVSQMMDAAAVGMKLSLLLTESYATAFSKAGFRATTAIHAMAGAAALSYLQEKSTEEVMKALGIAAGSVQGLAFSFQQGTEEWFMQVPVAAESAVLAARTAASLYFSHPHPLSGEQSLGSWLGIQTTPAISNDLLKLTRIGVKKHPVNSFVQPVVEAILRMKLNSMDGITEITVRVPEKFSAKMPVLAAVGPFSSPNLGLLSIPVSISLALQNRGLSFADFRRSNEADIVDFASKVRLQFDSKLKGYDVEVDVVRGATKSSLQLETQVFYPSLEEEQAWLKTKNQQGLPWIDRLLNWFVDERPDTL